MRVSMILCVGAALVGCSPGEDDSGEAPAADLGADLPAYTGGACPALVAGRNDGFATGASSRTFHVVLPPEPQGAPLVFVWHWFNGSAQLAMSLMDLENIAATEGYIFIVPEGASDYEWELSTPAATNTDLVFFDDLLTCAYETYGVDLDRVYSTGHSAGGLWTSLLTAWRSERFAAVAPSSGGWVDPVFPATTPIPVLMTWGGPTDAYAGFDFDAASQRLSAELQGNGHFVVECVHDGGHTPPLEAQRYLWDFFAGQDRTKTEHPWESGLPADLPSWCHEGSPS